MSLDAAKAIRKTLLTSNRRDPPPVEGWISKSDRWEFHRLGGPVLRGEFPLGVLVRPGGPAECASSNQVRLAPPSRRACLDQVRPALLRLVHPGRLRRPALLRRVCPGRVRWPSLS